MKGLETRLKRILLFFDFLLYSSRAVEEIIIASKFLPAIFVVCALLARLYLLRFFWPG